MSFKPYVVKLKGAAQCTFVYMSQADAEKYEKVLLALDSAEASGISSDLSGVALGLQQNPETKRWELVTVNFSPLTKEAKVASITDAGSMKQYAVAEFKKAAMRNKIV